MRPDEYSGDTAVAECWDHYDNVSYSNTYADYPDIESDAFGGVHVVWNQASLDDVQHGNGRTFETYYRRLETPQTLDLSSDALRREYSAKLAVDFDGNPHVVFDSEDVDAPDCSGKMVDYVWFDGSSWSRPLTISGDKQCASVPDIIVDQNGVSHVVFTSYFGVNIVDVSPMMVSVPYDIPQSVSRMYYYYPRIELDLNGSINIVTTAQDYFIIHSYMEGDSWKSKTIIDGGSAQVIDGNSVLLAADVLKLDSSGRLQAILVGRLIQQGDIYFRIYRMTFDGESWSEIVDLSSTTNSRYPSLKFDGYGRAHLVWMSDSMEQCPIWSIWYQMEDGGSWTTPRLISPCEYYDESAWAPDITIDSYDMIHVVWEHSVPALTRILHTSCQLGIP